MADPQRTWLRRYVLGRGPVSSDVAAMLVFTGLFTMAVWLELDTIGVALLACAFGALALAPHFPVPDADGPRAPALTRAGFARGLPMFAVIALPIAIRLIAIRHEEFPWSGDHFYHLTASGAVRSWWSDNAGNALAFVGVVLAALVLRGVRVRAWALVAFAIVVVLATCGDPPPAAARYPSSAYVVEVPLRLLFQYKSTEPPLALDRISMALSVPVWLFVLRPLVLRRWPDLSVLPFALVYFWQKDVAYWTTAPALEPWSIMFVLLAVELALSDVPARRWLAPLLVGVAGTFKEPAILVLPWIWLAGVVALPRTLRAWVGYALNGFLALLPFFVYYQFRAASQIERKFELGDPAELTSSAHLARFAHRVVQQFGASGLALVAVTVAIVIVRAWREPERRWLLVCLLGAVASQVAFFYVDVASAPWTGYPRFHLLPLAILAVAAWSPSPAVRARADFRRLAVIASIAIAALQLPTLIPDLALLGEPDPARNHSEADDAPVYFPIRELIREAQASGALEPREIVAIWDAHQVAYVEMAYPKVGARHRLPAEHTDCVCTAARPALLVPVDYPTGIRSAPGELPVAPETAACIDAVRRTYARVFERAIDGYPTGVLGVGCK